MGGCCKGKYIKRKDKPLILPSNSSNSRQKIPNYRIESTHSSSSLNQESSTPKRNTTHADSLELQWRYVSHSVYGEVQNQNNQTLNRVRPSDFWPQNLNLSRTRRWFLLPLLPSTLELSHLLFNCWRFRPSHEELAAFEPRLFNKRIRATAPF